MSGFLLILTLSLLLLPDAHAQERTTANQNIAAPTPQPSSADSSNAVLAPGTQSTMSPMPEVVSSGSGIQEREMPTLTPIAFAPSPIEVRGIPHVSGSDWGALGLGLFFITIAVLLMRNENAKYLQRWSWPRKRWVSQSILIVGLTLVVTAALSLLVIGSPQGQKRLELFSLGLAVAAMFVAIMHLTEIHGTVRRLDSVERSMSTRYLGQFPAFFQSIVKLVESARDEIVIFCDFPAYSFLSDPATSLAYQHALQRKALKKEIKITFICLGPHFRDLAIKAQFPNAEGEWNKWKQDETNNQGLRDLILAVGGTCSTDRRTYQEFLKLVEDRQRRTLAETFHGANVHEIETFIPVYFWLVDGIRAVFSIASPSAGTFEYGFWTTDQKLISALLEMRDQYDTGLATAAVETKQLPSSQIGDDS